MVLLHYGPKGDHRPMDPKTELPRSNFHGVLQRSHSIHCTGEPALILWEQLKKEVEAASGGEPRAEGGEVRRPDVDDCNRGRSGARSSVRGRSSFRGRSAARGRPRARASSSTPPKARERPPSRTSSTTAREEARGRAPDRDSSTAPRKQRGHAPSRLAQGDARSAPYGPPDSPARPLKQARARTNSTGTTIVRRKLPPHFFDIKGRAQRLPLRDVVRGKSPDLFQYGLDEEHKDDPDWIAYARRRRDHEISNRMSGWYLPDCCFQ